MAALCGLKTGSLLPPFPTQRLFFSFSSFSPISSIVVTNGTSFLRALQSSIDTPVEKNNIDDDESRNSKIWNKPSYVKSAKYPVKKKTWYIIDAKNKILRRLASAIAYHILGQDSPTNPPMEYSCAYVIVVNAEKVIVPRPKMTTRTKGRSGKRAVLKKENLGKMPKKVPAVVIKRAVWDFLPMRRLGKRIVYHLKLYKGLDHPHEAQLPTKITVTNKDY